MAQRLVRKLCKEREKYFLSSDEIANLAKHANLERILAALKEEEVVNLKATWEKLPFYKPKKSSECEDGYSGRIGIHETLKMSSALSGLIMKNATAQEIEEQGKKEGMMTMIEDGIFLPRKALQHWKKCYE